VCNQLDGEQFSVMQTEGIEIIGNKGGRKDEKRRDLIGIVQNG